MTAYYPAPVTVVTTRPRLFPPLHHVSTSDSSASRLPSLLRAPSSCGTDVAGAGSNHVGLLRADGTGRDGLYGSCLSSASDGLLSGSHVACGGVPRVWVLTL